MFAVWQVGIKSRHWYAQLQDALRLSASAQGQHQLYVKLMSMKKLQGNDPGTAVPLVPEFWLVEVQMETCSTAQSHARLQTHFRSGLIVRVLCRFLSWSQPTLPRRWRVYTAMHAKLSTNSLQS